MNSLIQILFVNSDNGFADESQVYSFALLCGFPWGKKIKIISPFVCFFHISSGLDLICFQYCMFSFDIEDTFSELHRSFSCSTTIKVNWIMWLKQGITIGKCTPGLNCCTWAIRLKELSIFQNTACVATVCCPLFITSRQLQLHSALV